MNSCSLSRAQAASAIACLLAIATLALLLVTDRLTSAPAALLGAVVLLLAYSIRLQRHASVFVGEAAEVCRRAAGGDLEARILGERQPRPARR
jgi:hypothetical protein